MTPQIANRQSPIGSRKWLLLALLALVVLRLPGFLLPMDQDSGCYAYVGVSWTRGALPYRDVWDHKPPGIYLIPVLLQVTTGSVTPVAMRACAVAFGAGTLLLVYGIAAALAGRRAAVVAAFVYAICSSGVLVTRETLETEHPMAFLSLLAVWLMVLCARQWRPGLLVLAGLCAGASVTFKPISAPVIGLAFLWLLWQQRETGAVVFRGLIAAATMGVGFLIVPAVFLGYFAAVGILGDFVQAFRYNFVYRAAAEYGGGASGGLAIVLARVRELAPEQGWLVVLALCGAIAVLRRRHETGTGLLLLWAIGAAIGMAGAGRFYAYYFLPLCAALAPLAGLALVQMWEGFRATPHGVAPLGRWADARHTLLLVLAVALAAFGLWRERGTLRELRSPLNTNVILDKMARRIRANTSPGEQIFVWGTRQQVYALADRPAPTRYTYDAPFRHRSAAQAFFGEKVYEEMAEAIRGARCRYIVVTDPRALEVFPELRQLLADNYFVEEEASEARMTTRLYRRKPDGAVKGGGA